MLRALTTVALCATAAATTPGAASDLISSLPGIDVTTLPFKMYSGYVSPWGLLLFQRSRRTSVEIPRHHVVPSSQPEEHALRTLPAYVYDVPVPRRLAPHMRYLEALVSLPRLHSSHPGRARAPRSAR